MWKCGIVLAMGVLTLLTSGCGAEKPQSVAKPLKSAAEALKVTDLERFFRLVRRLPNGQVPEFTPLNLPQIDTLLPARLLVGEFRDRYRQLCDPVRQGREWDKQATLLTAVRQEGWTNAELAAFVRCLSWVVMKSQLMPRYQIPEIEKQCRQEITRLVTLLEKDERRPRSTMTEAYMQQREVLLVRLGRMVALSEFILQLKPIPAENLTLIAKHQLQLQPLLTHSITTDPFADPFGEAPPEADDVLPVSYQTPSKK